MLRITLAAAALGLATACAEDVDHDANTFSSGLDPARTLSDLDAAEMEALCRAAVQASLAVVSPRRVCEAVLATQTDDPQACAAQVDSCLDRIGEPDADEQCQRATLVARCPVTVADFEACIAERLSAINDRLARQTCAHAAQVGEDDFDLSAPLTGAACAAYQRCLDDTDEAGGDSR